MCDGFDIFFNPVDKTETCTIYFDRIPDENMIFPKNFTYYRGDGLLQIFGTVERNPGFAMCFVNAGNFFFINKLKKRKSLLIEF